MSARVNVRELRQNLSKYLVRVTAGETLEVLQRGHPVAVLAPLPREGSALERLIAAGLARPASGDLLELGPPPRTKGRKTLGAALQEQREEG